MNKQSLTKEQRSVIGKLIYFCLTNRLIVFLFIFAILFGGFLVAPFNWKVGDIERYPISVDAIPDIGENQQIIFTQWPGRSPQDIEDQISYPLTVQLLGIPGVKNIRSFSMFGFSTVYIIFNEKTDFYWSRSRVLEKINSLPAGLLPNGVQPSLGPDATALGQVYWYTLEGYDPQGNVTKGWSLDELRSIQDFYVKYWLMSADGVSEVASVGGYEKEYQIDVDPDALRAFNVHIQDVYNAVKNANIDVGAKGIEINSVEYFIRGVGFIKDIQDIEESVIKVNTGGVPIRIQDVAIVNIGPASRRGALDKAGSPAVGGVVVARYGDNPIRVIKNVKKQIEQNKHSLPSKAIIHYELTDIETIKSFAQNNYFEAFKDGQLNQKAWLNYLRKTPQDVWPEWVTISQLKIVPFYDRTGLIYETLQTLNEAIYQQILITCIVVLIMLLHLRSSILISTMLPLAVLMCFIFMKLFNVQANIVALSGIAIAIGTIVDMGVVLVENIIRNLKNAPPDEPKLSIVHRASSEVAGAVLTAVLTTIISFLPVFTMIGAEGKLFKPLAFTKTAVLVASIIVAITVLPVLAHMLLAREKTGTSKRKIYSLILFFAALYICFAIYFPIGILLLLYAIYLWFEPQGDYAYKKWIPRIFVLVSIVAGCLLLAQNWEPLGIEKGILYNTLFVTSAVGGLLLIFFVFQYFYLHILKWCLNHKILFLSLPITIVLSGFTMWLGANTTFSWLPKEVIASKPSQKVMHLFPGFGKEFMPALDEGSYLFMPTTMAHASIGEAMDVLSKQDLAFSQIPEIDSVVGKLGRAETPLDPAPISMIETIINYKTEYIQDEFGRKKYFRYENGEFVYDQDSELIEDKNGQPFRQWRSHIKKPDDIWNEIVAAAKLPGTTSAPKLQPIAARIVMLASGMRAPMGIKVKGPDLDSIEKTALEIEKALKEVPSVSPATVVADRIVGKPYLVITPDRKALARYGIPIKRFQDALEIAVGGRMIMNTVEGRERYPVRVRYMREMRDSIEAIQRVLVPAGDELHIPMGELAQVEYVRGPQVIKSEDTFLVGYVVFDKKDGYAEVDVVEQSRAYLQNQIEAGKLHIPNGVSYSFAGNYQNELRASKTLKLVLPISLFIIFVIIYMQFKSSYTTLLIFSGVFVAWSGGFILIWLYPQPWFLDFNVFGVSVHELFQLRPINMSVAVWVGFLALFGIATDDGVVMGTYLTQLFRNENIESKEQIHDLVLEAGSRRIRPCLMTTATTILALLPVLTSSGRGSDIMVPMAIPSFGGMLIALITILVVPVLYAFGQEIKLKLKKLGE
ncbi:MAG: efflux RND transporter permease subunit [Lentisphaeria bacterium]|nr:efflux RND transporter permease subunit [Lentisphaeria bacterium]